MKAHWKGNLRVGVKTVVCVWLILFVISVGKVVYNNHQRLVKRAQILAQQNSQLNISESHLVNPQILDGQMAKLKEENDRLKASLRSLESPEVRIFPVSHEQRPGIPTMEYVMTTGKTRTPVEIVVACDFPISAIFSHIMTFTGGSVEQTDSQRIARNEFKLLIYSPAWSPEAPLWVTIFFDGTVDKMPSCRFAVQ